MHSSPVSMWYEVWMICIKLLEDHILKPVPGRTHGNPSDSGGTCKVKKRDIVDLYDAGLAMLSNGTPIRKYQANMMFGFPDQEWIETKIPHLWGVGDMDDENSTDGQSEEHDDSNEEQMDLD